MIQQTIGQLEDKTEEERIGLSTLTDLNEQERDLRQRHGLLPGDAPPDPEVDEELRKEDDRQDGRYEAQYLRAG